MRDLIERQAAIDDFTKWQYQLADCFGEDYSGVSIVKSAIKSLEGYPSAQPEIIRCCDCKHHWIYRCMDSMPMEKCDLEQTFYDANVDYCSLAERRTDG